MYITMKLLPLLLLTLLFPLHLVRAEGEVPPKVALSCTPRNLPSDEKRVFTLNKGEGVAITCFLINTTKDTLSGMLLAKQNSNLNGESTASSTSVTLEGEESKEVSLSFGPVFVPGNYYYSATFMGTDGHSLSRDTVLSGVLVGETVLSMATATLDKGEYGWTDSAKLSLTLTASGQEASIIENEKPTVSVAMLTKDQVPCAYLLDKRPITQAKDDYVFTFSDAALCANTLRITLQKADGTVMDQKVIAVSLPERTQGAIPQTRGKSLLALDQPMGILVWVGVLCLIFLAYTLWRQKRK